MVAKYDLLKMATVTGSIFSIYHAFANTLLVEDLIIVLLVALTLVAVAKEVKSKKSLQSPTTLPKEIGKTVEETIKEKLAAT